MSAFEIAGVTFRVVADDDVTVSPCPYSKFPRFEKEDDGATDADETILVRISPRERVQVGHLSLLARSSKGLTWYREGDGFLLRWRSRSSVRSPAWLVRVDAACRRLTFYPRNSENGSHPVSPVPHPAGSPIIQVALSYALARRRAGLLHHAAAICRDGRAYLFPGRSGAGKSTLASLVAEHGAFDVMGDDRVFSRRIHGQFAAFGTPWPSTSGLAANMKSSLAGLCFLTQAIEDRLEPLSRGKAIERLLAATDIPWWDRDAVPGALDYCEDLVTRVPAYELHFKPTRRVAELLWKWTERDSFRSPVLN